MKHLAINTPRLTASGSNIPTHDVSRSMSNWIMFVVVCGVLINATIAWLLYQYSNEHLSQYAQYANYPTDYLTKKDLEEFQSIKVSATPVIVQAAASPQPGMAECMSFEQPPPLTPSDVYNESHPIPSAPDTSISGIYATMLKFLDPSSPFHQTGLGNRIRLHLIDLDYRGTKAIPSSIRPLLLAGKLDNDLVAELKDYVNGK